MDIVVPAGSESITEVFIGEWYVAEGDYVGKDDDVVNIESDKASMDVPAPEGGRITKILVEAGDVAEPGQTIAHLEPGEAPSGGGSGSGAASPSAGEGQETQSGVSPKDNTPDTASPGAASGNGAVGSGHVMPAAARVMAEKGLEKSDVAGSGPGGRVLKEDAQNASAKSSGGASGSGGSGGSSGGEMTRTPAAGGGELAVEGAREQKRVRMSPVRQTIARRLVEAQQTAALLTTFNEVDMSAVKALRAEHQDSFVKRYGIKLGFMSFFVKAACEALAEFPAVGAVVDGRELVYSNYADIGVAIGGGKALVVPVLRNAERMGFAEVEQKIAELAGRAKKNEITLEEMEGGNFTITNGGVYGSLLSTPIVNPPQSGVLGMHGIVDRPVAIDGEVVIRPMMYLALTYDHRVVDGREAVSFLKRIKDVIENPVRLILEV